MACTFTDKLSAEIRVMIYGYVFCSNEVVRRTHEVKRDPSYDEKTGLGRDGYTPPTKKGPAHTEICAVSRKVSDEAIETFYKLKTIRGSPSTLSPMLLVPDFVARVQRLQITDYVIGRQNDILTEDFAPFVVKALEKLPRLHVLTVLTDYALAYSNTLRFTGIAARDVIDRTGLGLLADMKCVDIGRYTCAQGKVEVINTKLLKMWPNVKSTPSDYDALRVVQQLFEDWGCPDSVNRNAVIYASQTSLRCWVGLYKKMAELNSSSTVRTASSQMSEVDVWRLLSWSRRIVYLQPAHRLRCHPLGSNYCFSALHELGPDSDSEILEWATELLSLNIAGFYFYSPHSPMEDFSSYFVPAHWTELEGGEHYGREYISKTIPVPNGRSSPYPSEPRKLRAGQKYEFPHTEMWTRR